MSPLRLGLPGTRPLPEAVLCSEQQAISSPSGVPLMSVGGTSVGGALGVLGEGILPGPVKIVCQVLGVATDLLILKVAGVVCSQGRVGRE